MALEIREIRQFIVISIKIGYSIKHNLQKNMLVLHIFLKKFNFLMGYTTACAKDSGGPYDYNMVTDLVNLAKANELKYAVDIYPMYGSDVGAALKGGNNIRGALIGPGVHASHGMERTHYSAFENTIKLLYLYLTN